MSNAGDRHRRGPGGPARPTRSGRTTPPSSRRHRPDVSGLLDPTVAQMVAAIVASAREALPDEHPAPGVVLEQWAVELGAASFSDEAMPREFYADLGRGLQESPDDLAPAVLAALALAVDHRDATPLRKARAEWLATAGSEGRDADLGIGREQATRAIVIGSADEAQVTLVVGFAQAGTEHAAGVLVDHDDHSIGRDLWLGPALDLIEADARIDADLVVEPVSLTDARARIEAALVAAAETGGHTPEDEALLPLVVRRLATIRPTD